MKSPLLLAFAALALPVLAQAPKWAVYAAKADGFLVVMPGKTQIQKQNAQGLTTNIYLSIDPPYTCVVSKTILPSSITRADRDAIGPAMKSSMMKSANATPGAVRMVTYSGIKGEQTDFKAANGNEGATWIAQTPRAVYSVTFAKKGGGGAAEMKRFFLSFKAK